ncbi:MAG: hypothetical protein K2X81_24465 [Candidatus Obscuribacterales bacterium]|nr:hypothetical protein [Candidatus Obscuribacterales bacterium]
MVSRIILSLASLLLLVQPSLAADPVQTEATAVPASEDYQLNLQSNGVMTEKLNALEIAINKFKDMGVGVAAFEQNLIQARSLQKEGRLTEAEQVTEHLNLSLQDQQKRYYASKILMWRSQMKLAHAKHASLASSHETGETLGLGPRPKSAFHPESSAQKSNAGTAAGLAKGAHSVLSKTKSDFSPLIYPIAR